MQCNQPINIVLMNDNGNIRLLTPENDMRVRAFLSSLEELSEKVEKIRENNKPSLDGERYYTDKELAVRLKVSRRSLQDYRNNGILPYIQIGGRILYRASDIERTLKDAYEHAIRLADAHTDITVDLLKSLSALVLKNTGQEYKTVLGDFSSARGDLRLLNVTAGAGGKSYMNYSKVPAKLSEFCTRLNRERENHAAKSMTQLYEISFDAHYDLVTIHPWADGNGRMARLLMNMLQFEFGLIPTKILKEDKEEYIKALVETRENEDLNVFREFMTATMIKNLTRDIEVYRKSIDDTPISGEKPQKSREKKVKSREKIMALLSQDNTLSAATLAERIGITAKAVEKQIAALKADGVLRRIGPDKGGYWQVVEKKD